MVGRLITAGMEPPRGTPAIAPGNGTCAKTMA